MRGVVGLDDVLATVAQRAVAEQEARPPSAQVLAVRRRQPVRDEGDAERDRAMRCHRPPLQVAADLTRVVDLGVRERLVVALVPAGPAEHARAADVTACSTFDAEAVLGAALLRGGRRCPAVDRAGAIARRSPRRSCPCSRGSRSRAAARARPASGVELELEVLAARAARCRSRCRCRWRPSASAPRRTAPPIAARRTRRSRRGVAARIGRVVVGAVVVDRPVRELEMAVAADGVDVEEIRDARACRRGPPSRRAGNVCASASGPAWRPPVRRTTERSSHHAPGEIRRARRASGCGRRRDS